MYNEELITEEQLEELMKKADELNAFIKEIKRKNRLTDYAKLRPLNKPRNIANDAPIFGFSKLYNSDAWNCFCKLAKLLHENADEFYMSTSYCHSNEKYIRSNVVLSASKFEELTNEQMRLSGQMIDEMIAVYNKYYMATHVSVIYDAKDGTGKVNYPVFPPTDERYIGGTCE